ncbi:sensor domain-containing diguanylate cyclase [Rhodoferax aquaticus]|nr:7TM diverse intracellular signaling domain-containing protein [Rhodoferax aquaticus]
MVVVIALCSLHSHAAEDSDSRGALEPLVLDARHGTIQPAHHIALYLEAGAGSPIETIVALPSRFSMAPSDQAFALTEANTLWLRLQLQRTSPSPSSWTLHVPLPYIDSVTLFQKDAKGQWIGHAAGDVTAVSRWARPGLYPEFELQLASTEVVEVFIKVRNYKAVAVPLKLQTAEARESQRQIEFVLIGVVLGTLLMVLGNCCIQYATSKNAIEAYYIAYITISACVVCAITGFAGAFVWPDSPVWTNFAYSAIPIVGAGATVLFTRHVCALHMSFPRFSHALQWYGWLCLPLLMLCAMLDRTTASAFFNIYYAVAGVVVIAAPLLAWRRGDVVGKWLLFAYGPQSVGVMVVAAQGFGLLPPWWQVLHGVVLAIGVSVPLMLHALHLRARARHEAEDRVNALGTQDALTGLLVKPVFLNLVQRAIKRAQRDQEPAAIVLVEVVNHGRLKQLYGEAVAEQCLLRAVVKLHRVLRDVDPAGRVSAARFGMVLEGVSTRQALSERMVSLIASGLIPLPQLKPEVSLQFHIACVMLNESVPNPDTVMGLLSDLLADIAPKSRRPIRFLEHFDTMPASDRSDSGFDAERTASFLATTVQPSHAMTQQLPG